MVMDDSTSLTLTDEIASVLDDLFVRRVEATGFGNPTAINSSIDQLKAGTVSQQNLPFVLEPIFRGLANFALHFSSLGDGLSVKRNWDSKYGPVIMDFFDRCEEECGCDQLEALVGETEYGVLKSLISRSRPDVYVTPETVNALRDMFSKMGSAHLEQDDIDTTLGLLRDEPLEKITSHRLRHMFSAVAEQFSYQLAELLKGTGDNDVIAKATKAQWRDKYAPAALDFVNAIQGAKSSDIWPVGSRHLIDMIRAVADIDKAVKRQL